MTKFNPVNQSSSLLNPQILMSTSDGWWVDKPVFWLTVDATSKSDPSPVLGRWLERETGDRVWPTHRLDRETSGVVFFARNAEAHRQVSLAFEKHEVKKEYVFVANGSPTFPSWIEKSPIQEQKALTQFEIIERFGTLAFFGRAFPKTGRRHQIRLHLKVKGHPILGDREYGGSTELFKRVALHARRLEIPKLPTVESPLPLDFNEGLRVLRNDQDVS